MPIEHCASAYKNGFDAWQFGYDDAMFDGIDVASELPCICLECLNKYHEGQEAAIKEIFAGSQSAQQSAHPTLLCTCFKNHLGTIERPAQNCPIHPQSGLRKPLGAYMKNLLEEIKFLVVPNLIVLQRKKHMPRFSIRILGKVMNFGTKEVTDWPVRFRAFGAPKTASTHTVMSDEGENMEAKYKITITWTNGAAVRPQPNVNNVNAAVLQPSDSFDASELVPDSLDPTNQNKLWAHVFGGQWDGMYVAVQYETVRAIWRVITAADQEAPIKAVITTASGSIYWSDMFTRLP